MKPKPLTNREARQQGGRRGRGVGWLLVLAWLGLAAWGYFHLPWRALVLAGALPLGIESFTAIYAAAAIALVVAPWLAYQYWLSLPATPRQLNVYRQEQHRRDQRQLTAAEARRLHRLRRPGLPLASLEACPERRHRDLIGLEAERLEGHCLVVGNTGSGKGMHLTEVLLHYPHAALVVDPKSEQYTRTAGYRARLGPVYRIPPHTLDLADYYDLGDRDDVAELHYHLLQPWADHQPVFAEKAKSLFTAAYHFARAHQLNPLRVLLDAADSDPALALAALMTADKDSVLAFSNGRSPDSLDRMSASAWGTFTTRTYAYQAHVETITTWRPNTAIPLDWAAQNATIYITYPLPQLKGVGGIVSAIVTALLRRQVRRNARTPALIAVDELPAVGLRNVSDYLATVRSYRLTLLLYVQTYAQLAELYGERGAETILANCQHQVWYPPVDGVTARRMEELYGTALRPGYSLSRSLAKGRWELDLGKRGVSVSEQWARVPALAASQVAALDAEEVILRLGRRDVVRGYRLWPVPRLASLPPLAYTVQAMPVARPKTAWQTYLAGGVVTTTTAVPAPAAKQGRRFSG